MLRRVLTEDWMQVIPIIAFAIFATVFIIVTVRAIRLGKKDREHMASLPLDD
ncbi:MAG: hypothetical protein Q7R22_006945 [Verrucomicrobiota bacterium JB025]|nr:hypothetical protein [Verrucomicrobiota bacterium JB025]